MRTIIILPVVFLLSACATGAAKSPPPSDRIQTTEQINRGSVSGAVSAPMRDLNVVRAKVPPILLTALDDPYERPKPLTCAEIIAQIRPLTAALGADIDEPSIDDDRALIEKGTDAAENSALGFVASAAQDLIPLRGWVRKLSGAERHDRLVRAAITAGGIRRGYLKGLGESKGCKSPATPNHEKSLVDRETPEKGPRYPVR